MPIIKRKIIKKLVSLKLLFFFFGTPKINELHASLDTSTYPIIITCVGLDVYILSFMNPKS